MKFPKFCSRSPGRCGSIVAAIGIALACTSCGQSGPPQKPVFPAQGKVLFKGKPITPAVVVLHPKDGSLTEHPHGETRQDGVFKLSTYSKQDGAPAGEYDVTVSWMPAISKPDGEFEAGKNQLPDKYAKRETSGLTVKITAGENNLQTFELSD